MTKNELAEIIRRRLGYPLVKVELDQIQITDAIDYSRKKFIKWAVGQATQETFITVPLSAGVNIIDLPIGVVEVVSYNDDMSSGGINTLFTIDNFLYNQGVYDGVLNSYGGGYNIISYHLAMDFLETLALYNPSSYSFKYHRYTNQLEINPTPVSGNTLSVSTTGGLANVTPKAKEINSPGYIMLRTYMLEGTTTEKNWKYKNVYEYMYDNSDWILDYSTAMCKVTLGHIRNKFANFTSIGNNGISMDGSDMISEGKEEMDKLEETLRLEESFEGYPVIMG